MGIKRLTQSYEKAKAEYHRIGELAKQKGPDSFEAEKLYPDAKARYHQLGERLQKASKQQER
jgi:hypothetical protein